MMLNNGVRRNVKFVKSVATTSFRKIHNSDKCYRMCQEDGIVEEPKIRHEFQYNSELKNQLLQIDYENCKGNFVVDGNGNILLDLFQNGGSLPLGYNHDSLMAAVKSPEITSSFLHMDAEAPVVPSEIYIDLLEKTLLAVAPSNLSCVKTTLGDPLVGALHLAVARYQGDMHKQWDSNYRGLNTDMNVYSKHFTIMAFEGSTCTTERCPYNLEAIKFPKIKRPFEDHLTHNRNEESECLDNIVNVIKASAGRMKHAAALVVDPNLFAFEMASPEFYNCLRMICTELNILFLVNEVDTGLGATGTIWAHDKWNLTKPPDAVIFGKKMMASGFYFNSDFEVNQPASLISGPVSDPTNLMLLDAVLQTIAADNLFQRVDETSSALLKLKEFEERYPSVIESVNCSGILTSIIFNDTIIRQHAELALLNAGLHLGKVSDRALILRPALILTKDHVTYFYDIFDATFKSLETMLQTNGRITASK